MKLILYESPNLGWFVKELKETDTINPVNHSNVLIIDTDALGPHASDTERAAEVLDAEGNNALDVYILKNLPPIIRRVGKTEKETT